MNQPEQALDRNEELQVEAADPSAGGTHRDWQEISTPVPLFKLRYC